MLYQRSLTIPAGTAEADAVSETLILALGVSTRREVYFPAGCNGLVYVKVFNGGWQVVPWNRDEWLSSSNETVVDESPYPIPDDPEFFTVVAYNSDPDNAHTIQLRVQMREGRSEEYLNLERFLDALKGA